MGCLKKILNNPLTTIATDVGLSLIPGGAAFIPLANAAERTAGGVANGESFGKALGQGAISGGLALGGQELAGAVGIGSGNTAVNNALGITWDNPASLGLPDIGAGINNAANSVGNALGFSSSGTAAPVAGEISSTGQPVDASGSALSARPAAGTALSGGGATPSQVLNLGEDASNALLSPSGVAGAAGGGTNLGTLSAGEQNFLSNAANSAATTNATGSIVGSASPASGGFLNTIKDAAVKNALPLGALAYQAISGPGKLPEAAQPLGPGGAVTEPLLATEKAGVDAYNSGTLTPGQQAGVSDYIQQQQNALIQQLASQGVTDVHNDSRYISGVAKIKQDALAMQNNILQQDLNNAFTAAGAAGQNLSSVASQQVQQDTAFQNALAEAMAALGGTTALRAA